MNERHPSEERLNDYVDGALDAAGRASVREHLDDCAACRRAVGEIRGLVEAARRLDGEREPSRDLFPGIRAAIAPPARSTRGHSARWIAVAATVALAAIVGLLRFGGGASNDDSIDLIVERFRAAEREYLAATELLVQRLEQNRDELPPETLAVLDRNLAIVDQAIAEVRQSLDGKDPNVEEERILNALYDRKLQVLWQATRLGS